MNKCNIFVHVKRKLSYHIHCFTGSWMVTLLPLFLLLGAMLFAPIVKAQFRASVVKVDITPDRTKWLVGYGPRQSTGVHDHIYHRIIALDDGITQFFLISSDLGIIAPSEYDKVVAKLQKEFKIDPLNVWWAVTHTHSTPEVGVPGLVGVFLGERFEHPVDSAYTSIVEQGLINGIIEARKKLAPAKIGVGWGFSQANINRRAIDVDGKVSLGMDPDGAVDRRIGLLRIDKEDGSPLALIANYPMHGTVLGANLEVSGDAPGIVAEYVEQKSGVPMLFINGAGGNMAPLYSGSGVGHLNQFKVLLGDKILDAYSKIISATDKVKLFTGSFTVETPRKAGLGWPSDLSNYTKSGKGGTNMIQLPIRFLKINEDVAIWSAPIELFCEVSNEIRDHSPFPYTFYFGYTNGWLGYMPTASAWEHGGYETTVSPYTPLAAKNLSEAVLSYLGGEMRSTH